MNEHTEYGNWDDVPEHLKTKTALKKLGLRPKRGQEPVAYKTHWHWKTPDYALYDMNDCETYTVSDAQRAALEKAQAASLASRTCTECGYVEELSRDYRNKTYVRGGLCDYCREVQARQQDKQEIIQWARDMLARDDVCILDTETTDLYGQVIELAIIDLAGTVLYDGRIKPTVEISEGAQNVHGITMEMLADAPTFADEYERVKALMGQYRTVLIYNAQFDDAVLRVTCEAHNLPELEYESECLMEAYAVYCQQWSDYHRSYRWQPLGGGHSALSDCRAALATLREMAKEEPA